MFLGYYRCEHRCTNILCGVQKVTECLVQCVGLTQVDALV